MISSATQLLMNDIRQTVSNSYLDDSRMSLNKINQKPSAVLATRFNCMQAWFLRCSRLTKLQFLTEMMNSLKTLSSLSIILNTLKTCSGKSTIYSLANNSNFFYDKGLNDHNRSLDGFTLKEVEENDLKWFRSLQDSSEQVLILLGLIRLGGGLIMYEIYKRGVKLFEDLASRAPVDENKNVEEEAKRKPKREIKFSTELDLKDPFVMNTYACKEKWNNIIQKYKKQVMLKESPAIKLEKKPNEMNINKKKKTISESNDLDFLQLMPITIVKKIFGYLNSKTLKTIKQVNLYWEFAVNDLQADMKGRKTLNKCIKKMKKSLPEEQVYEENSYNILRTAYDISYPKKRLRRLVHRGAALRKLTNPLVDTTVFKISSWTDKSNDLDSYYLQVENLKLFPRTLTVSHPLHQQAPPRSLKRRYTAYDDLLDVAPEHNEDDNSKKFKQVFDKANVAFSTTPSVLTTLFKNN